LLIFAAPFLHLNLEQLYHLSAKCHNIVYPWVKISDGISKQINPREETMDEETLRKMAIEQYLQGKNPSSFIVN